MQLRDKKEIFTQLPVGSAIVKLSERHTSPFLIEVPFTDLRDLSVEDSKVKTKMNCVIEGYEIEKNDPEFKEKIIYKENLTAKKPLVTSSIKPKKEEILVEELNQTQKVLLEFVKSKLSEDKKLNEIEKLLDSGIDSGYYSKKDVLVVINIALSWKLNFNKSKPSVRKAESVEIKKTLSENLTKEELSFVNFLMGNSNHCMSTVELYKSMGLSSRKGNVIKEKLFQKGILKIEEERNEKGWRKLIKLSNSYSL